MNGVRLVSHPTNDKHVRGKGLAIWEDHINRVGCQSAWQLVG